MCVWDVCKVADDAVLALARVGVPFAWSLAAACGVLCDCVSVCVCVFTCVRACVYVVVCFLYCWWVRFVCAKMVDVLSNWISCLFWFIICSRCSASQAWIVYCC